MPQFLIRLWARIYFYLFIYNMKVLIIYPTLTHPVNAGNKQWALSQAKKLIQLGCDVYMLCINAPGLKETKEDVRKGLEETKRFWGDHVFVYNAGIVYRVKYTFMKHLRAIFNNGYYNCDDLYPQRLDIFVNKINKTQLFDVCIVNYYWLSKVLTKISIPTKVINTHDIFSFRDQVTHTKKAWMCTMPNEEAKALQRSDIILALQDEEAVFFSHLAPNSKVKVVYCPYEVHNTPLVGQHNLLMLASANELNIKGLEWFVEDVFPLIIAVYPDVKLILGGYICKAISNMIKHPNIVFIGSVQDPMELYTMGDVAINPVYDGTGLKIKTFEALSYGKIAMTHPHSVIGVYKKEESGIFYSENPKEWVNFLGGIWDDYDKIQSLKQHSIEYINNMNSFIEMNYKSLMSM